MAPSRGRLKAERDIASAGKRAPKDPSHTKLEVPSQTGISLNLQQRILNVFKATFADESNTDLSGTLQQIKQHLYYRDFSTAFGCEEYLRAYCARWSPSRALGYLQVLVGIDQYLPTAAVAIDGGAHDEASAPSQTGSDGYFKVACLGAGAGAEIAAFAAYLWRCNSYIPEERFLKLDMTLVDIADWSPVVQSLCTAITQPPKLSAYASPAIKAANVPFVGLESLECRFQRSDLLNMDFSELPILLQAVNLVTLMFTLNELYSTSLSQTQRFLLQLGCCLQKGALLLVVDSPGSYSTVQLNGKEKRYPMHWLLDHTLQPHSPSGSVETNWQKLVADESRWFRLPDGLSYPIKLENMRYQIHLYQRI